MKEECWRNKGNNEVTTENGHIVHFSITHSEMHNVTILFISLLVLLSVYEH